MNEAKINGHSYTFPASWNELEQKHALKLIDLFLQKNSTEEIKLRLLFFMLGFKFVRKQAATKQGEEFFLVRTDQGDIYFPADQLAFLSSGLDFLFTTNKDGLPEFNSELSKNLLPSFRHQNIWFYGPADRLFNLSWTEYIQSNANLSFYASTKDSQYLDLLIACLYRPGLENNDPDDYRYTGDPRQPFNDYLIDRYAAIFASLPLNYKHLVYLYYIGSLKHMRSQHPAAFGSSGGGDPSLKEILSMIDLLAKNDVTKTDQIEHTNVYKILINIEQSKLQQNPKRNGI